VYNNGGTSSYCVDIMPAADCTDMAAACTALYGENSTLMQMLDSDDFTDVINALDV